MPTDGKSTPRTQSGAPVKAPGTTEEPGERERDETGWPERHAGDERGDHGDRMPKGADEPGAGL